MRSFEIFFLNHDSHFQTDKRVMLILSSAYYWFKQEQLKVTLTQAKKLASSIFEGSIPPGNYSYFVQKVGQTYHFYAYDERTIIDAIKRAGLKPAQIYKIYPMQMLFSDLKEPVKIGDSVIYAQDGIALLLPPSLAPKNPKKLELTQLPLPPKALPVRYHTLTFIPKQYARPLLIITLFALILFGAQLAIHYDTLSKLQTKQQQLTQRYHLPPTTLQLDNILASLQKIEKEQLHLRSTLAHILQIPHAPKEYLELLHYGKTIRLHIHVDDPKRKDSILQKLSPYLSQPQSRLNGTTLEIKAQR